MNSLTKKIIMQLKKVFCCIVDKNYYRYILMVTRICTVHCYIISINVVSLVGKFYIIFQPRGGGIGGADVTDVGVPVGDGVVGGTKPGIRVIY